MNTTPTRHSRNQIRNSNIEIRNKFEFVKFKNLALKTQDLSFNVLIRKFYIICLTVLFAVLSFDVAAQGQGGYPKPADDYVNDFAGVMSKPDSETIRKMFKELENKTGIEALVVTINSIDDYNKNKGDATIESFATNLFNTWGIGHKKENNGVLILVAVKDRKCRIELGKGYGRIYDPVMKQVIDENMIPYFKTDEYSRGIFEGSRGVIEKITQKVSWYSFYKWHILIGLLIIVCIFAGISCMRAGKSGWGWAFFAAAGMLIFFIFSLLMSGKSSSGFGGGSSFGGGASGSW
jgi:uncharacterized protein